MSTLAVVLNFCPVYCPYCAQRLRIIDDQQRRTDFFNAGAEESCSVCGARFNFGPYPTSPQPSTPQGGTEASPARGDGEKATT